MTFIAREFAPPLIFLVLSLTPTVSSASDLQEDRLVEFLRIEMEIREVEWFIGDIEADLAAEYLCKKERFASLQELKRWAQRVVAEYFKGRILTRKEMDRFVGVCAAYTVKRKKELRPFLQEQKTKLAFLRSQSEHLRELMAREGSPQRDVTLGDHWTCSELGYTAECPREGRTGVWVCNWAGGCSDSRMTVRSFDPGSGEIVWSRYDATCDFSKGLTAEYRGTLRGGVVSGTRTIRGAGMQSK